MATGPQNIRAWSVGLDMAYSVGGMLLLGAGIDWLAGTKPWWMLGLGLLGLIVGMYKFIRDAMKMNAGPRQGKSALRDRPPSPDPDREDRPGGPQDRKESG